MVLLISFWGSNYSFHFEYSGLSFVLYYLYLAIPFALNVNDTGSSFLSTQLPFLVIPILFGFYRPLIDRVKDRLLLTYSIGITVATVALMVGAAIHYKDQFYLFLNGYYPVTDLIGMHPSYLSMFISLAFLAIFDKTSDRYLTWTRVGRVLSILWLVFLAVMVFYVRSRAGIFVFIFVVILIFILKFKGQNRIIAVLSFLALLLFLYVFILISGFHIGRFQVDQTTNAIEIKKMEWQSSFRIIEENPWFGVGVAQEQVELNKQYERLKFEQGVAEGFNSHNQFLTTLLQGGIIGFGLLFGPLLWLLLRGFLNNRTLDLSVAILIILSFTTESMLSRHKGVIFYSFFILLFLAEGKLFSLKRTTPSIDSKAE